MKRYIGYLFILVGFLFIAIGVGSKVLAGFSSLPQIPPIISNILGIALVITGIYFSWNSSTDDVKHASAEVPIYEGEGKHRKIVGYRKTK